MRRLTNIIKSYNRYLRSFRRHPDLKRDIVRHIADALPHGLAIEWLQGLANLPNDGRFTAGCVVVFVAKEQVWCQDGMPAWGCEPDEPGTEWIERVHVTDGGYFFEGAPYKEGIPGLSKDQLANLIRVWRALPLDVLDKAFGDAVVRVEHTGRLIVKGP